MKVVYTEEALKDLDAIADWLIVHYPRVAPTVERRIRSIVAHITRWPQSSRRTLGVPPAWFPRLLRATPAEREQIELSVGLHWEAIDEDISVAGLLAGRGDVARSTEHAA